MRRRFIPYLCTLSIVFMLALSIMYIPSALSQNESEIIESLEELHDYVSTLPDGAFEHQNNRSIEGKRRALGNKVNAVIHQIKSGAYHGAISKLTSDIKEKADGWLVPPWDEELKDKVQDIINRIKGIDFSIEASPTSLTIALGESDFSIITITSLNSFSKSVSLTVFGVPPGVTTTLDPTQVTPPPDGSDFSTLTVHVDSTAVPESYVLTVAGTSGTLEHSVDITLEITELPPLPDFDISASPTSLTIQQGDSDFSTITIASKNGFSAPVDLAVTSASIIGVTTTLNPTQVIPPADDTETSTLTVSVDISATLGEYILTVTGTNDSLQRSVDIALEITELPPSPDFSIEANPAFLRIVQGSSDTSIITVTSKNGFSDLVTLTVSPAIDGVTYSLDPSTVTPPPDGTIPSTITIAVAKTATPNSYVLDLTGTSGALQRSASLSLEITTPPDVEPPTIRIDEPANESYVAGLVNIVVFMHDQNFKSAELTINNKCIASWTPENVSTGEHSIFWDTTLFEYPDGLYNITLSAEDKAGNDSEEKRIVTVDNTLPTIRIDEPVEGSYLAGVVNIKVFIQEDNLDKVELTIDDTVVVSWTISGEHVFNWNTTTSAEGVYFIKLNALDKAGNIGEKTIKVIVDNTAPTALIHAPTEGSYLKDEAFINVTGDDANFEKMELRIGVVLAKSWTTSGDKSFLWNTGAYSDGTYKVTLTVFDKANNSKEVFVTVALDNASPEIEAPTWTPREPSTDEDVNVTVKVSDRQPGSGIQSVTLWYRNTTMDDWQPISMSLNVTSGNWTATIPAQSMETTVEFYIEAFDNADNRAESVHYEYEVIAPAGIPLAWIVVIILLILAATAAAIYFWRKRRKEKQSLSSGRVENYKLTILFCF